MSHIIRKPVFGVSAQFRHKPWCTAKEDGETGLYSHRRWLEALGSRGIFLFYFLLRRSISDHYLRSCGYVTCSRPQQTATGGLELRTSRPKVLGFTTVQVCSTILLVYLWYTCTIYVAKNKFADQLRSPHLHLCFRICKNQVFS